MTVTAWLRLSLLASVTGACAPVIGSVLVETDADTDTDTDTPCDIQDLPQLTGESTYDGPDRYLVCGPFLDGGECAEGDAMRAYVQDQLGPVQDPDFCGWWVKEGVCGPVSLNRGQCCYAADVEIICEGRPLSVDEGARTASAVPGSHWLEGLGELPDLPVAVRTIAVPAWRRAALAEHASIASFARFTMELLALGAPASLVEQTTQAQADEVRHARVSFSIVDALSDGAEAPGPLPLHGVHPRTEASEFLAATLLEGCVNETLAAARAAEAARRCTTPPLAAVLARIAEDESRHAALAWRTVRWMLGERPELGSHARQVVLRALEAGEARTPDAPSEPASLWYAAGLLPPSEARRVDRQVLTHVVRPIAEAVIGSLGDRCAEA